jgi:hypothetical protein
MADAANQRAAAEELSRGKARCIRVQEASSSNIFARWVWDVSGACHQQAEGREAQYTHMLGRFAVGR